MPEQISGIRLSKATLTELAGVSADRIGVLRKALGDVQGQESVFKIVICSGCGNSGYAKVDSDGWRFLTCEGCGATLKI